MTILQTSGLWFEYHVPHGTPCWAHTRLFICVIFWPGQRAACYICKLLKFVFSEKWARTKRNICAQHSNVVGVVATLSGKTCCNLAIC